MVHLNLSDNSINVSGLQDAKLQLVLVVYHAWHVVMVTAPGIRNRLLIVLVHQSMNSCIMCVQDFTELSLYLLRHNVILASPLIDLLDKVKLLLLVGLFLEHFRLDRFFKYLITMQHWKPFEL